MKAITIMTAAIVGLLFLPGVLADESQYVTIVRHCEGLGCLFGKAGALSILSTSVPGAWQIVAATIPNTCPLVSWTCPSGVDGCGVKMIQIADNCDPNISSCGVSETMLNSGDTYIYDRSNPCYVTWNSWNFWARTYTSPAATTTTTIPGQPTTTTNPYVTTTTQQIGQCEDVANGCGGPCPPCILPPVPTPIMDLFWFLSCLLNSILNMRWVC